MPKDKRIKGCPNIKCERNSEHYKYKAEDRFCTKCGSELVFMCPKCYGKLADVNSKHKLCSKCEALIDDKKHNASKRREARRNTVKGAAHAVVDGISDGANTVGRVVKKAAKQGKDLAVDAYKAVAEHTAPRKYTSKVIEDNMAAGKDV